MLIIKNNDLFNAQEYLYQFDQILKEMSIKMLNQNITNSITLNFIKCMIPHHQAAIYMCENLLKYTKYPPLQKIAYRIIKAQTESIKKMQYIARTTTGYPNSINDVRSYMENYNNITYRMIYLMNNSLRTTNINLNFTSEMIPHHEGAIAMCQNLLQYQIDPRLREVAISIINLQSEGIKELQEIKENLLK